MQGHVGEHDLKLTGRRVQILGESDGTEVPQLLLDFGRVLVDDPDLGSVGMDFRRHQATTLVSCQMNRLVKLLDPPLP